MLFFWTFLSSNNPKINIKVSTKISSSTTIFNTDKHQILDNKSISEWFLKDHVTLKTSNDAENTALHHRIVLHFNLYYNINQLF